MNAPDTEYVAALEEALLKAESALADINTARRKRYLAQASAAVFAAAYAIRRHRAERCYPDQTCPTAPCFKNSSSV